MMKINLKRVHVAPYWFILRQDDAISLRIIFEPLPTPKRPIKIKKMAQISNIEKINTAAAVTSVR